jgi:hypothetical protein
MTAPFRILLPIASIIAQLTALAGGPVASITGFVPNRGQVMDQHGRPHTEVRYLYSGAGLHVQLRDGGFSYDVFREHQGAAPGKDDREVDAVSVHRIDVLFEGSDPNARWTAFGPAPDVLNYHTTGTGVDGVTGVPHYVGVRCRDIYPSIDVEFRIVEGEGRGVKYDLIVRPGGDPSMIRMRYAGAELALVEEGTTPRVTMRWEDGVLHERIPRSYWMAGARRTEARVVPVLLGRDLYTFRLEGVRAPWSDERVLVIDPVPELEWGTYYGAPDAGGSANGVAIDGSGNTLMAGTATLTGLATSGAHDVTLSGTGDALLVKFGPTGQRLWATYYGGPGQERGSAVHTDAANNVLLAGETWSTSAIATPFAHQPVPGGESDAFLARFSPSGVRQWATYYGGEHPDMAYAITVDGAGCPILAGQTFSLTGIATPGAADTQNNGTGEAFLAKFDPNGVRQWGSYLGGNSYDKATGLSCDGTFIFVAGVTGSPFDIATPFAHQPQVDNSSMDAFLVKYSGLGQKLWGTYYGGSGAELSVDCVAEQGSGVVHLSGTTTSTTAIATLFAHQSVRSGPQDGFLAKFNANGARQWGTYVGGTGTETVHAVALGSFGRIHIAGRTNSTGGISTPDSPRPTLAGSDDAFVMAFTGSGTRLWGTYHGGAGEDEAKDIAVSGTTCAIAGLTRSLTGISTPGAFQGPPALPLHFSRFLARFSAPALMLKDLPRNDAAHGPTDGDGLRVFPNPASERVLIEVDDALLGQRAVIELYDATGRHVLAAEDIPLTPLTTIELPSQLHEGVYVLMLRTEGRSPRAARVVLKR